MILIVFVYFITTIIQRLNIHTHNNNNNVIIENLMKINYNVMEQPISASNCFFLSKMFTIKKCKTREILLVYIHIYIKLSSQILKRNPIQKYII